MTRWMVLFWLMACGGRADLLAGSSASTSGSDAAPPTFPTGVYACSASLEVAGSYQGEKFVSVEGGNGTLTVTQSGVVVTAGYTGDKFLSGTLRFDATTDSSAEPVEGNQSLTFMCFAPFPQASTQMQPLSLVSGSLTVDGTTLFLSFTAIAEPTSVPTVCDGLKVPGTLTCTSQP